MSVKYSVAPLINPQRREEPAKYFAKAQVREVIDIDRIAREIAHSTSLAEGDVLSVFRSVPHCVTTHLADGDLVDLGDLGRLQFQISSKGAFTREEFTHHNITRTRIQFRPGKLLTQVLNSLRFEEVIPVKEKVEAKRKSKGKGTGTENP